MLSVSFQFEIMISKSVMHLKVSVCFLNLYNFNQFETYDKILLGVGVPLAFLWLGFGVGMVRHLLLIPHQ